MNNYEVFKKYQVHADSIEDFCTRYHQRRAYHNRGEEYMSADLEAHKADTKKDGFTFIPRHDSVTGEIAAYYPGD